ncbi:STAS domain-containing protein [Actinoplanes sp. M2I2]|uniref:STAS domain-containing protein n=1 Tax=Actinoplanes sp. M2I2 TaxID=1734444 RepID=UPI00201FBCCE|nr:STAS domain-containing protein [Actinoplanes sp. M2I2]
MSGPFAVHKHDEGGGVVRVAVHGEIDQDVGAALTMIIINATDQADLRFLVVDLERVSFLAAAGVRSLLEGHEAARARGCGYQVINANGVVADVLTAAAGAGVVLPSGPAPAVPGRSGSM